VPQEIKDAVNGCVPVMWVEDHTTTYTVHPQFLVNTAITVTKCDWIVKLDVDDLILPHALNSVKTCRADVLNFGYQINGNDHVSRVVTPEEIVSRSSNEISSCSPFRRKLWERNKFLDMVFDDWGFWFQAARDGATFAATGTVDYLYRVHPEQITRRFDSAQCRAEVLAL
jgi:hypothetical protein